jgi:GNAT superfamily N-acetyltransferase
MIDNVDAYYETIRSKDAIIHSAPQTMEWGLREMLVGDPDDHYIRFGQNVGKEREKSSELPETFSIVDRQPTVDEYLKLTGAVEWNIKGPSIVEKVLNAALFAAVAVNSNTNAVAGCVLVIGDDATFYYIKDMMVDPAFQGQKVGSALMERVNEWLNSNAETDALVALYTGENLASFYRQFGFKESFGMTRRIRRTE